MQCRYCGKPLGLLRKLADQEFCSAAHQKAYAQEQEQLVLARLLETRPSSGSTVAPPPPAPESDEEEFVPIPIFPDLEMADEENPVEAGFLLEEPYMAVPEYYVRNGVVPFDAADYSTPVFPIFTIPEPPQARFVPGLRPVAAKSGRTYEFNSVELTVRPALPLAALSVVPDEFVPEPEPVAAEPVEVLPPFAEKLDLSLTWPVSTFSTCGTHSVLARTLESIAALAPKNPRPEVVSANLTIVPASALDFGSASTDTDPGHLGAMLALPRPAICDGGDLLRKLRGTAGANQIWPTAAPLRPKYRVGIGLDPSGPDSDPDFDLPLPRLAAQLVSHEFVPVTRAHVQRDNGALIDRSFAHPTRHFAGQAQQAPSGYALAYASEGGTAVEVAYEAPMSVPMTDLATVAPLVTELSVLDPVTEPLLPLSVSIPVGFDLLSGGMPLAGLVALASIALNAQSAAALDMAPAESPVTGVDTLIQALQLTVDDSFCGNSATAGVGIVLSPASCDLPLRQDSVAPAVQERLADLAYPVLSEEALAPAPANSDTFEDILRPAEVSFSTPPEAGGLLLSLFSISKPAEEWIPDMEPLVRLPLASVDTPFAVRDENEFAWDVDLAHAAPQWGPVAAHTTPMLAPKLGWARTRATVVFDILDVDSLPVLLPESDAVH